MWNLKGLLHLMLYAVCMVVEARHPAASAESHKLDDKV